MQNCFKTRICKSYGPPQGVFKRILCKKITASHRQKSPFQAKSQRCRTQSRIKSNYESQYCRKSQSKTNGGRKIPFHPLHPGILPISNRNCCSLETNGPFNQPLPLQGGPCQTRNKNCFLGTKIAVSGSALGEKRQLDPRSPWEGFPYTNVLQEHKKGSPGMSWGSICQGLAQTTRDER